MPEDAARRFAVMGAVEPIYNKNIIIWQITLHAITKETAQEAEASGLPVSAAPVGENSDYDTYAAIEIDADRKRITEVQDRIIWLTARRHGTELELKDGTANEEQRKEFFNAGMMLTEEQKEQIDEEAELRRAEIAEADQKTRVLEDLDGKDSIIPMITKGLRKYCGQVVEVGSCTSQTNADKAAAWVCKCEKASSVRRMREQIADAQEHVSRLFGEGAVDLGFKPIAGDGVIEVLERLAELIARGSISTAAINVRGQCMAKFSVTSKGKIKVSRSETRSCNLEAGE